MCLCVKSKITNVVVLQSEALILHESRNEELTTLFLLLLSQVEFLLRTFFLNGDWGWNDCCGHLWKAFCKIACGRGSHFLGNHMDLYSPHISSCVVEESVTLSIVFDTWHSIFVCAVIAWLSTKDLILECGLKTSLAFS